MGTAIMLRLIGLAIVGWVLWMGGRAVWREFKRTPVIERYEEVPGKTADGEDAIIVRDRLQD